MCTVCIQKIMLILKKTDDKILLCNTKITKVLHDKQLCLVRNLISMSQIFHILCDGTSIQPELSQDTVGVVLICVYCVTPGRFIFHPCEGNTQWPM